MVDSNNEAEVMPAGATVPVSHPFATECDLIMKGGITSGIVYPLAITELSKAFRLRSIGGTSAGAIAAAAAAAAELGRQRHDCGEIAANPDGFERLANLPEYLGSPATRRSDTRLLAFFKPKAELRPTFDALAAAIAVKGTGARMRAVLGALLHHHWFAGTCAFVVGTLPLGVTAQSWPVVVWLVAFALVLMAGTGVWRAVHLAVTELPKNGFGLCSGMPSKLDPAPDEALTIWLARYIDDLAGQGQAFPGQNKPLTFGDLKTHGIHLQILTTCLTLTRPFRLPFRDDEQVRENKQFLYKKTEFEALFPQNVVDWMVAKERPHRKGQEEKGPFGQINFDDFLNLPDPDDLPVVVAARMSLSFPLLLSAIPLYSIDFRKKRVPNETPERCWFTDGGVGSNFPIHFFDSPLPARPTFGLDLAMAERADDERVVFPKDNGDARLSYWRRFANGDGLGALTGFLGAVVNVAKDWNHETLSHLPGFRDRIGLIKLTENEGGLNLTMPKSQIGELAEYGRAAGREFVVRFGNPGPSASQALRMNWENHQLIRLRLLLASLTEQLESLKLGIDATTGSPSDYARFFTRRVGPHAYRFKGLGEVTLDPATGLHASQAALSKWILDQLVSAAEHIADTVAVNLPPAANVHPSSGAPKPTPELKLRPRV